MKKFHELETDEANLKYQFEQFEKRQNSLSLKGQNPHIYDYYKTL